MENQLLACWLVADVATVATSENGAVGKVNGTSGLSGGDVGWPLLITESSTSPPPLPKLLPPLCAVTVVEVAVYSSVNKAPP
jgi:hypothetical protein